jgi:signal transduction histidine kinase
VDHWRTSLDVVERLREQLQDSERKDEAATRALMAQVAHAKSSSFIALLDNQGCVLDVNPAALIAGGVDRSEVIGLPLWTTPWWLSAGTEVIQTLEGAVLAAAAGRLARLDIEIREANSDRLDGTLDLVLRPLRGRNGQIAFIVAEGRSITDRKLVERRLARNNSELSALTDRLARVHDYRERLVGELSHDLRAPLQVVITRSEQILRTLSDAALHGQIAAMRLAALDALEQINNMQEQVRSDHGEARLTLVEADLAQAVRAVTEQFEPLAAEHGLRLTIEVPETASARFDVERISRIVSNLLANAIRHAPHGGVVRCSLRIGDAAAALEVADSGPGVPPEHRQQVFGRYKSALSGDGRSSHAGAGLGLAIVREFVELHGGDVSLDDAPEGGALFVVTLPLRPPTGPTETASLRQHLAAAQRTQYVAAHLEAELAGEPEAPPVPTVVILERVAGRAEAIVAGIGEQAVTCVAADAEEALHVVSSLRPHAVVVGTSTGSHPATWLLRRLAADQRLVGVRRIALAGEREEDEAPEVLLSAGAQLVLPAATAETLGGKLWSAAVGNPTT